MPHNLIIRGFDDDIHSQLGDLSRQKGVSINSIVKDAVDKWLKNQKDIPKRHHLLIYDNEESMKRLLGSIDKLAKEGGWFRCFVRSSNSSITEEMRKLAWFDGTTVPYKPSSQTDAMKYINSLLQNISLNSNNKQICLVDFLINDIADSSVKQACYLEKEYDKNRLEGLVFCAYEVGNLFKGSTSETIEMFELHDQVFILNNDQIYKLHLTRENVHKLFLS
jgi:hypothetical protein